ncbi:MAG TPA: nitrous oxide reductase accessory protein NosL [Thermoanaerobaculia bacterium]|nr:nitrous oxide reductase accessory protein NosL [Thermoanaerobaculia bacterium]
MRRLGPLTVAWLLAACATAPDAALPPEIRWGVDECSRCHMILSEERFAAAARSETGEEARFDDLECAADYLAAGGAGGWTTWVVTDAGWRRAGDAWLVYEQDLVTPMGSGLVAYASEQAARDRALAPGSQVLRWQELTGAAGEPPDVAAPTREHPTAE